MRRLLRILIYAATGLSGTLCIATCILWARSYAWADQLECWSHPNTPGPVSVEQRLLWSQRGWVGAQVGRGWSRRPHDAEELRRLVNPAGLTLGWERRTLSVGAPEAYHYQSSLNDPGWGPVQWRAWRFADPAIRSDNRRVRLPHWLLALICGALPFTFLTRSTCRAVRRLTAAGECPKCGYDLRATPEPWLEELRDASAMTRAALAVFSNEEWLLTSLLF